MKKIYKSILALVFLLLTVYSGFAQDGRMNLRKYWFYRYRLTNDFMVKGPDCMGCSEILNEREHRENGTFSSTPQHIAKWGDQSFNLGAYIGVLATEFKLEEMNGQPTDTTLQELAYAMRTFNRLDENAEHYYAEATGRTHAVVASDLNGFFVRDDVPSTFLDDHPQLKPGTVSTRSVSVVGSDYQDALSQAPDYSGKTFFMSHDQIYPILMGMALVRKYLYNGVHYNTMPLNDVNGNINIWKEAEDITDRIIDYVHDNDPLFDWTVTNPFYPDTGINRWTDIQGYQIGEVSYGLAEAGCFIKDPTSHSNIFLGFPIHSCEDYHDGASMSTAVAWNEIGQPTSTYATAVSYEVFKAEILATIGNSWYTQMFPAIPSPIQVITSIFSLWPPRWEDIIQVIQGATLMPINVTQTELYLHARSRDNQYMPLMRMLLHGGGNFYNPSDYQELLDLAPCEGPYNFSRSENSMSTYEWSARDRLHDADERGGYVDSDHKGSSQGEYPGLDYMLYYNLYAIAYGTGSGVAYTNYKDRRITIDFPYTLGGTTIGSHASSTVIEAFNTIDANADVNTDGQVDFHAGESIHLMPGFHAVEGCNFHAYIEPFVCATGDYRMTTASNDSSGSMHTATAYAGQTTFINYPKTSDAANYYNDEATSSITQNPVNSGSNITQNALAPTPAPIKPADIHIQPNPNNGSFELVINAEKVNAKITLVDMFGNTILQQMVFSTVTTIDLNGQAKGVYYLRIENGQSVKMEKVVYQ